MKHGGWAKNIMDSFIFVDCSLSLYNLGLRCPCRLLLIVILMRLQHYLLKIARVRKDEIGQNQRGKEKCLKG